MLQEECVEKEKKKDITHKHHTNMHPIQNPEPKPKPDSTPGAIEKEQTRTRTGEKRRSRMHKEAEMDKRFQRCYHARVMQNGEEIEWQRRQNKPLVRDKI